MNDPRQPELGEPQVPERLISALKDLHRSPVVVPPSVDHAILTAAQEHFAEASSVSRARRWPLWLAAAAAVTLAAWPAQVAIRQWVNHQRAGANRADIDRNGRIDILDALALARRIETRTAPPQQFDLNGDGVVDRRDVDLVAAQAVKLDRRPG